MDAPVCGGRSARGRQGCVLAKAVRTHVLESGRYPFGGFVTTTAIAQYRTSIQVWSRACLSALCSRVYITERCVGSRRGPLSGLVPWIVGSRGCQGDGIQFMCECGRVHAVECRGTTTRAPPGRGRHSPPRQSHPECGLICDPAN